MLVGSPINFILLIELILFCRIRYKANAHGTHASRQRVLMRLVPFIVAAMVLNTVVVTNRFFRQYIDTKDQWTRYLQEVIVSIYGCVTSAIYHSLYVFTFKNSTRTKNWRGELMRPAALLQSNADRDGHGGTGTRPSVRSIPRSLLGVVFVQKAVRAPEGLSTEWRAKKRREKKQRYVRVHKILEAAFLEEVQSGITPSVMGFAEDQREKVFMAQGIVMNDLLAWAGKQKFGEEEALALKGDRERLRRVFATHFTAYVQGRQNTHTRIVTRQKTGRVRRADIKIDEDEENQTHADSIV